MFFVTYLVIKSGGIYDRNIFAYESFDDAVKKRIEVMGKYQYMPSEHFQCFLLDDEGRCINNNLEK